ncbi:MAG TPA: TolC family protein, partial [Burkholderiaceae bacterium]
MEQTNPHPGSRRRRAAGVLLATALSALGGCAQMPNLGPAPAIKPVEVLGSAESFAAAEQAWPGDQWWRAYGDPQLDALIDEALRDAPDLRLAQARLSGAAAVAQGIGATRMPEVTAGASLTEEKQSYNSLMPRQAVPLGWNDYGVATVNLGWELDFWGKNRSALAAAVSEQQAAKVEVAQARL